MAEILRKNVLTAGGIQNQFVGVRLGGFLLRPDSDSGTRPDDLRVEGPLITVVVEGGKAPLRVKLHSEGIAYRGFQGRLSTEQKFLLTKLASDLHGRIWPDAGETLRRRIESLGEDNVLRALQKLFDGVGKTMRGIRFYHRIPCVGHRLEEIFFPVEA